MKVLVLGSSGYLGNVLVSLLNRQGHKVIGLDNFLYWQEPTPETRFGDITSLKDMYQATKGVDVVISLAAIVGDAACDFDEVGTININFEATKILLQMCEINNVKKLVFASSCSVYGESDKLSTESSITNPLSLYAKTRLMSENLIMESKVKATILRFGTLFGYSPRMRFDLVANLMTGMAMADKKVIVKGGSQWRPMLHVEDAAESITMMMKPSAPMGIFNVVGENVQIKDIAETVKSVIKDVEIVEKSGKDKRDYKVDSTKIRQAGFVPKRSLAVGIKEMKQALRKGNLNYKDSRFYNVDTLKGL